MRPRGVISGSDRTGAIPFFGTTGLEHIDPPLVRRYIDHGQDGTGTGWPGKRKRVAGWPRHGAPYYAPVRALFATAYDDGLIARNPAAGVR